MSFLRTAFPFIACTVLASCAAGPAAAPASPAPESAVIIDDAPPRTPPKHGVDYRLDYDLPSSEWVRVTDEPRAANIAMLLRHEPTMAMVFVDVTTYDEVTPESALEGIRIAWEEHPTARIGTIDSFERDGMHGARLTSTFEPHPGFVVVREFEYRQLSERFDCSVMTVAMWPAMIDPFVRADYERLLRSLHAVPLDRASPTE